MARLRSVLLSVVAASFLLAGCAHRPPASDPEALRLYKEKNDPLEPMNRITLRFNEAMDRLFLRQVTLGYRAIVPAVGRKAVENFLRNLRNPVYFANSLLQGDVRQAGVVLGRLIVNSTIGIGGLGDPATKMGLVHRREDFGQTLAVWGVGDGFYLVLPFLGPSSLRDTFGLAGDVGLDPFTSVLLDGKQKYLSYVRRGLEGLDLYERSIDNLDDLRRNSLDYYSAVRSFYRQNRKDLINNGKVQPDDAQFDDFDDFDDEEDKSEKKPQEPPLRWLSPLEGRTVLAGA